MKDLDERLVELINQNSSVTLEMQDVADELDLAEKLGMDSMSFVQLIIALEAEFGDTYEIHTMETEQDLKKPCFFVKFY